MPRGFSINGRVLLIAALIAIVAASWWIAGDRDTPRLPLTGASERPDYSMVDFTLTETDETGRLGHTLRAENLYHYAEREESLLTRPRLLFFEEDRPAWDISAEHGVVSDVERSVLLSGDVQVRYAGPTPERSFEIYTGELHVWPEERRAETADAVRIVQQSAVTDSIGMSADLDVRRLRLPSQVRGRYEP